MSSSALKDCQLKGTSLRTPNICNTTDDHADVIVIAIEIFRNDANHKFRCNEQMHDYTRTIMQ